MKIAQEENFGPVLAVMPFETEAEAVQLANGTLYGLVSGVWTKDIGRAGVPDGEGDQGRHRLGE